MSKREDELGWHARHVMQSNPEFFGTAETWDPKLRRKAEEVKMANNSLSIDDVGKPSNPYEEPAILTNEEALTVIAEQAYNTALLMWGESTQNPRLTINDRVLGAVYSTFELLQNGVEGLIPPMELAPVIQFDESTEASAYLEREGVEVRCYWPDEVVLAATPHDAASMTATFSNVYDRYRDRLAAAAIDLFQLD